MERDCLCVELEFIVNKPRHIVYLLMHSRRQVDVFVFTVYCLTYMQLQNMTFLILIFVWV